MKNSKRLLFLSIALQLSMSMLLLASMVTRIAAADASSTSAAFSSTAELFETGPPHLRSHAPRHRRRRKNNVQNAATFTRRLKQTTVETTLYSGDDDEDDDDHIRNGTTVCSPIAECELCPHNWRVLIEKEDEKIKGEYDSCLKYGRRRQFECTVLLPDDENSRKIARSSSEYRECRFTEPDEQFRMLRLQMICLLVGFWSIRNVRRQKVVSASLFDQRRMRLQNANNANSAMSGANKYSHSAVQRKDSMETVELIPLMGAGKVPKSPAPNPMSDPDMETV